jgi:hypothetical protein
MNKKWLFAGITAAIVVPLAACGGTSPLAPSATTQTANGAVFSTLSSKDADVQACANLQKAAAAFLANKNQDTLDAFAIALADRPGAAMSPSLDAAFSALSDDVQNEMLTDSAASTAQTDENAVADGCASAGVRMPDGFTG